MLEGQKDNDTLEGLAAASEAFARSVRQQGGSLDWLPIGVCVCDLAGRVTRYNSRAAALWGYAPAIGDEIFAIERYLKAADRRGAPLSAEGCPVALALRSGKPVTDSEITLHHPDGATVVVLANVDPLFDDAGRLVGAVKCFQDITDKKENEQRIRRGARQIRELIDALPAAIYTTDAEGKITFFNKSAVELWGREPKLNEDAWCGSHMLRTADGAMLAHDQCPMAQALKLGQAIRNVEAIIERPDGSRVPCMPYPTPFHDASGALLGGINMVVDITERKLAETRQKIMIDELNHRVKNSLATVQAIAVQTFRGADAPRTDVDAFLTRLLALSKTHDLLTREQWESANLAAIFEDVLSPLRGGAAERICVEVAPVRVSPRAALTLGLVLNELATNAMKYGAMSAPGGKLNVTCKIGDGALSIGWRESGGPPVVPVTHRGFGTRMIERGLASELDGRAEIRFAETGLECDLHIPLSALA